MRAVAIALLVVMAGCVGSGFDKARVVVTSAVKTEGDVEDSIMAAVQAEQKILMDKVVAGQMSVDEANAAYDAWRAKVGRVISALTVLHDALKAAAHGIDTSEALGNKDYSSAVSDVASAIASLVQALTDAGIKIPGVS
ncbi:MAG: hypothetical protein ACXWCS_14285 [Burkholderiales bacterium]